jgi:small GTP-binding protein
LNFLGPNPLPGASSPAPTSSPFSYSTPSSPSSSFIAPSKNTSSAPFSYSSPGLAPSSKSSPFSYSTPSSPSSSFIAAPVTSRGFSYSSPVSVAGPNAAPNSSLSPPQTGASSDGLPSSSSPSTQEDTQRTNSERERFAKSTTPSGVPASIKLVIFGAKQVGKTCLINRFVHSTFNNTSPPTVGASYQVKLVNVFGTTLKISLWDLTGADHFLQELGEMFYLGAHVIMAVYDVTDPNSLTKARQWIDTIQPIVTPGKAVFCLVGNKADQRKTVDDRDVQQWADRNQILWREASAATGHGVHELFMSVAEKGLEKLLYASDTDSPKAVLPEWVPDSSTTGCSACGMIFSFSLRRHHCRRCGFIFCKNCSTHRIALPTFGVRKPVRVCDQCYESEQKTS